MLVRITLSGPRGAGKSVIGELIAKTLGAHNMHVVHTRGNGENIGPIIVGDHDTVMVETTPETLAHIHKNQ